MNRRDQLDRVHRQLLQLMAGGTLPPGSRILETEIAGRLGVARSTTRAVLHRLEQEGHLSADGTRRHARRSVAPLTKDDSREIYHIRAELEGLAASQVAQRPARERSNLARTLRSINQALLAASQTVPPDTQKIFELESSFHRCFVDAGAGPRLLALHRIIDSHTARYTQVYAVSMVHVVPVSVAEHARIIRAIRDGDAQAARQAVHTNWHNGADRLARTIGLLGERGSWYPAR